MNKKKALITTRVHPALIECLEGWGYTCVIDEAINYEQALATLSAYEGVITSNQLSLPAALLDAASDLKWIGRLGSGMEIIDVAHAEKKGIACFSSPEGNANAVAEQALGMLLNLQHHISKAQGEIKNRQWIREENRGVEIEGLTAGIIGLGHNGSAFATKLNALGMNVLAFDTRQNNYHLPGVEGCRDLLPIYEQADVISFHVPLTRDTLHYFDDHFLRTMKKSFVLLNLSRGPVVSLASLYRGMQEGKVIAAALDVWEKEPYWDMDPALSRLADALMARDNFLGLPHIGGYSVQALYKMSQVLADKISAYLSSTVARSAAGGTQGES